MPNECQKANANEIGQQGHVTIRLYIHMVIVVLGFTWHLILCILSFLSLGHSRAGVPIGTYF